MDENDNALDVLDIVAEPANKAVTRGSVLLLYFINNKLYRIGVSSILLLKENIGTIYYGIIFKPFNPFFDMLNIKFSKLFEAGLIKHWFSVKHNPKGFDHKLDNIGPEILTMDHLEIGFIVWLIPLAISIVVFAFEVVVNHMKSYRKKLNIKRMQKYSEMIKMQNLKLW